MMENQESETELTEAQKAQLDAEKKEGVGSKNLWRMGKLQVLAKRGTIRMIYGIKPVLQKALEELEDQQLLDNEFELPDYSDEPLLAVEGASPYLLRLDEPFTFADQHFHINDDDIDEIYMEADDSDLDYEDEACRPTTYGIMDNPTVDDFLEAIEK